MTILFYTALILFLVVCLMLTLVILIQESKSLGLGASFGGDPGESIFGTSTAQVLKKFTATLALIFMVACVVLSIWSARIGSKPKKAPVQIEEVAR